MSKFKVGDKIMLKEYPYNTCISFNKIHVNEVATIDRRWVGAMNHWVFTYESGHEGASTEDNMILVSEEEETEEEEDDEYTFKVGDEVRWVDDDSGGDVDSETKFVIHSYGNNENYPYHVRLAGHTERYSPPTFTDACWSKDELELWEDIEEEDEDVIYPESEDKTLPSTKPDTHQYFPTAKQIKGYVKT